MANNKMVINSQESLKYTAQLWCRIIFSIFLAVCLGIGLTIYFLGELQHLKTTTNHFFLPKSEYVSTRSNISLPASNNLTFLSVLTDKYPIRSFYSRTSTISNPSSIDTAFLSDNAFYVMKNGGCNVKDSNLGFETGDLKCWATSRNPASLPLNLFKVVTNSTKFKTNALLMGRPGQANISPLGANGSLTLSHIYEVTVPDQGYPQLKFDYLMYSHDVVYAPQNKVYYDYFEVGVIISGTKSLLQRYGNPKIDWDGYASKCRPTPWVSNSGTVVNEPLSLDKYKGETIKVYFSLHNRKDSSCNSWVFVDNIKVEPELVITKSNNPSGPVHEGDTINYTISYANTGLATQTISITDVLPFNITVQPNSIKPANKSFFNGTHIVWNLGEISPQQSGQVSFQAKVPLLPGLNSPPPMFSSLAANSDAPAYVLPASISCDTTRFWASGVTGHPSMPIPHIINVQIPPGNTPSMMWLLMKTNQSSPPEVEGIAATLENFVEQEFEASLWSAPITPAMIAAGEVTVVTYDPRNLNAIFLFDADDPPFEQTILDAFYKKTQAYSYTLDVPSVTTQTIDVILPFMDINEFTDQNPPQPDTRITKITAQFNGQSHTRIVNNPNLGNGLLLAQFSFEIGPLASEVTTKTLSVTVDTEDSIYTLGPRICRPVYIENTAWLCSQEAGCISDTVQNVPDNFVPPAKRIYLPLIFNSP
ncbi:MAG: DUF11 domain-containing protein [Anaerolineae bacterium]|nr:DUF11 domain-containing protein [Anaerolineae bacterium]